MHTEGVYVRAYSKRRESSRRAPVCAEKKPKVGRVKQQGIQKKVPVVVVELY